MGIGTGASAFIGAAAPGVAQGINTAINAPPSQDAANNAVNAGHAMMANDPQIQALQGTIPGMDSPQNPLYDPNHPAWGVLANMTGGQGGPLPGGNGGASPVTGMQNGGVVRLDNGKKTVRPEFEKGPALPTGPNNTVTAPPTARGGMLSMENGGPVPGYEPTAGSTGLGQGITPARTEGEVQTFACGGMVQGFDAGGVVPTGFVQQPGISGVPMNGRGAALVEGLQAGQNLGHNIQQAWLTHEARAGMAQGTDAALSDSGAANQANEGPLGKAKDAVEGFFQHLHDMSLGESHKPNNPAGAPNGLTPPSAIPAGAGGAAPGAAAPQGAAPGAGPAPAISGAPAPQGGAANPAPAAGAPVPGQQPGAQPAGASPAGQGQPGGQPPGGQTPAVSPGQQPGAQPGAQPAGASPAGQGQPGGQPPGGQTPAVSPVQQQATLSAAQMAAQDPATKSGTPDQSAAQSGLPHSMTTYQWDQSNQMIQKAVHAAALAGEDPAKVYESLTAMRTAHIQGQVMRQYDTAYVALQNGNMDAVKQALSNANYYLPNGKGIDFKTADDAAVKADPTGNTKVGDLMYRNPFYGMFGHEKDQLYQTVTPMHLQMLAAATLDSRTVSQAVTSMYSAQQEAESNRLKARGEFNSGAGRLGIGQAAIQRAGIDQQLEAGRNYLNVASGELKESQAGYWQAKSGDAKGGGQLKVMMNDYNKAGQEAIQSVRGNVQGKARVEPPMVPDPNNPGKMIPNLSPAAGKSIPSAGAVPSLYQGMSANTQQKTENLAAQFAGANIGIVPPQEAGDIAARVVHFEEGGGKSTHMDPTSHTQQLDVIFDGKTNAVHVWTGNGYKSIWATPVIDREGGKGSALPTDEGGGGSGNSTPEDMPNTMS